MSNANIFNTLMPLNVGDIAGGPLYATQFSYDIYTNELIYVSFVGYKTAVDKVNEAIIKSRDTVNLRCKSAYAVKNRGAQYIMDTYKNSDSDLVHATIFKKDYSRMDSDAEEFTLYMYVKEDDIDKTNRLKELLYDKLYKYSSVPLLEEWIDYIYNKITDDRLLREMRTLLCETTPEVQIFKYVGNQESLKTIIQEGLKSQAISIKGNNDPSILLDGVHGLNDYLSIFGSMLAEKIQNKFKPKFIPGTDEYSKYMNNIDDFIHHKGVEMYEAQMATVQSVANNWKVNHHSFIVGEMGTGKTLQSGSACYVHNGNKNKGFNAIVMCPSHLVEKWKSEMERYVPNAKGYIIHNLDELLEIENKLRNKNRVENMFVIMSKEIAKLGFDERPAVIWSKSKRCFVCPECGQPVFKIENRQMSPYSRRKTKVKVNLTEEDFTKQFSYNMKCANTLRVWDKEKKQYVEKTCNANLWTALNRDDQTHGWIKLGEAGWIRMQHITELTEKYMAKEKLDKKESALFNKLFDQYTFFQENGYYNITYKGPKKYPIANYIHERMKGVFGYLLLDEAHLLMNNSLQGHAAHLLMRSADHTALLTGTLLNGYASNIFYTLFRVCPNIMKQEGFRYEDEMEFARIFGVTSRETTLEIQRGRASSIGNAKEKKLPGVSPLIFTKFLLNLTAFITLDQMTEGLPDYEEIPIGIEMDQETKQGYDAIQDFFRQRCGRFDGQSRKIMSSMIKLMTQYPDAPHCKKYVLNPDTGDVEYESVPLAKTIRNKEQKLLEIIQEKIANGEKVLVYYNTVNTTDIGDHLCSYLASEDIKSFELKASVKAEKRMEYITKEVNKGAQVMITNPSLVETGLDLLDFTTIIFYQIGYNLSTMRQASRRSWRLSQTKDIQVYFFYYMGTIQEQALSLMATKLQAAQTIEGNFSEEGLKAMSNNEDVLTQIANNVVDGIKQVVDLEAFKSARYVKEQSNIVREHHKQLNQLIIKMDNNGKRLVFNENSDELVSNKNAQVNNSLNLSSKKLISLINR